jgi:uncharacterized membrane protein YhiD involved in acid resistance
MIPMYAFAHQRISAAVGVACGVGLSMIATVSACTTLAILRLGRKKNKHQTSTTTTDLSSSSSRRLLELRATAEDHVDADDDDNINAEIHLTSVWDEHHQSVSSMASFEEENMNVVDSSLEVGTRQQHQKDQNDSKKETVFDEHENPSQLLDAAATASQAYTVNVTSFDFEYLNELSNTRKKKKESCLSPQPLYRSREDYLP